MRKALIFLLLSTPAPAWAASGFPTGVELSTVGLALGVAAILAMFAGIDPDAQHVRFEKPSRRSSTPIRRTASS